MFLPELTRESMHCAAALWLLLEVLGRIVIVEVCFTLVRSVSRGHELLQVQEGWA